MLLTGKGVESMMGDCRDCPMHRGHCRYCPRIMEQLRRRAHAIECGDEDEIALIDAELAAADFLPANDNSPRRPNRHR